MPDHCYWLINNLGHTHYTVYAVACPLLHGFCAFGDLGKVRPHAKPCFFITGPPRSVQYSGLSKVSPTNNFLTSNTLCLRLAVSDINLAKTQYSVTGSSLGRILDGDHLFLAFFCCSEPFFSFSPSFLPRRHSALPEFIVQIVCFFVVLAKALKGTSFKS